MSRGGHAETNRREKYTMSVGIQFFIRLNHGRFVNLMDNGIVNSFCPGAT